MRKNIVAGNWKMNNTLQEGIDLVKEIVGSYKNEDVTLIVGTPHTHLATIKNELGNNVKLSAQNCHHETSGAFTGEVSIDMLDSIGVDYVIIGHSERREYNHETDEQLAKKVDLALSKGITPIFCCGESLEVREKEGHFNWISLQLLQGLFHLSEEDIKKTVIAYEPIWAIGTGKTASPEQAQEIHAHIREELTKVYNADVANEISILYGGSCKPSNAKEIFANPDVDGGLIGGASLKAEDFIAIAESF